MLIRSNLCMSCLISGLNELKKALYISQILSDPAGAIFRVMDSEMTNTVKSLYICIKNGKSGKRIPGSSCEVLETKVHGKNMGPFFYSFHPDVKWLIQRLERINHKIDWNDVSVLFNQTHTHTHTHIYIYIYIYIRGGIHCRMVIILGNGHVNPSSNLGRDCIPHSANTSGKSMNSIIPLSYG